MRCVNHRPEAVRILTAAAVALVALPSLGEDRLSSPYQRQAASGLRGLNESEIADLRSGAGMGVARAAELNGYPGPRHVLDAIADRALAATPEQTERIRHIFDRMKSDAQGLGAQILEEERGLETAFRAAAITESEVRSRVARIAALQGELRTVHLTAHLATRAVLSEAQVARYDELRGYASGAAADHGRQHGH
jgi:hypothetical protein